MPLDAILFDLDNTLYPERQYVEGAYRDIVRWLARQPGIEEGRVYQWMLAAWLQKGSAYPRLFDDTLAHFGISGERAVSAMVDVYREHQPARLTLFKGARATLTWLRQRGLRLALVSDGHSPMQRRKIAALALRPFFDAVVLTGDWGAPWYKPHRRGYDAALEMLATQAAAVIFVGDRADTDLVGAARLGMRTLHFVGAELPSNGTEPRSAVAPADWWIANFRDLREIVEELLR